MTIRLLFLPLVLVTAFFSAVYFIKPLWKENALLKKEVEKLTINLIEVKGKSDSSQKVIGEYQKLGNEKALIKNALPEEKEGNVLLAEFFEKAKKSGVFLKSIKVGQGVPVDLDFLGVIDSEDEKRTNKQDVIASAFEVEQKIQNAYGLKKAENDIELIGGYEEVRNFILEVEKMNRFLNVTSVEFKKKESSSSSEGILASEDEVVNKEVVDVFLKVSTYWIKSREEEIKDKLKQGLEETKNISAKDLVIKSILGGKFSSEVISDFQSSITKDIFYFGVENAQSAGGKSNLF